MPQLSMAFIGPFQVHLDGQPLTRFGTDKARALLAYLVLEAGIPHRRENLADLFWPEQPQGAARQNLRQTLSRLGKAIGNQHSDPPYLSVTAKTVAFNPQSDFQLDALIFAQKFTAVQQHRHRRLETCRQCMRQLEALVALYRGEFLEGLAVDGSFAFDEWRVYHQERFHTQTIEALNALTVYAEHRGDYPEAIRCARRQLALEPWREVAYRSLMRALALSDQRTAALAQYETCRQILAAELHTVPEDATRTLHQQIKSGGKDIAALATSPVPHNLPTQLTPFFGREAELEQMDQYLDDPDCRLLTLVGPGGCGKTRLALQAAADQLHSFPDGVWFVPLANIHTPELLAPSIVQALGLEIDKGQDPAARLLAYLQPRTALLLLDNFEHLIAAGDLLIEILQGAPDIQLLVTSRERLNYQAEFLLPLEGLAFPPAAGAAAPDSYPAVDLFLERARRARPGFSAKMENQPHITQICQLVSGIPLALELSAAWTLTHSAAEIASQIQHSLDFLATSMRDIPARQRSLQATFDYSWQLLSEHERIVCRRLAIFQGPFTVTAAQDVTASQDVTAAVHTLADKSLLRRNADGRYDLHPLLKEFALAKLNTHPAESHEIQTRHTRHYLAFLLEREQALRGPCAQEALAEIQAEIGDLRAAWAWAVSQSRVSDLMQFTPVLAYFYNRIGFFQEGEAVFRSAAERLFPQGAPAPTIHEHKPDTLTCLQAHLYLEQARFLFGLGQYQRIPELTQTAIELAALCGDRLLESQANLFQGYVPLFQGGWQLAQACFERALYLVRTRQKAAASSHLQLAVLRDVEANALNGLGIALKRQGDYEAARSHTQDSLTVARANDDLAGQSRALNGLGGLATRQGDFSAALAFYREALDYTRMCGDRRIEGALLNNLGNISLRLGLYPAAIEHYEQSRENQLEIGARKNALSPCFNIGLAHHYLGNQEVAHDYFHQVLPVAQEVEYHLLLAHIWLGIGYTRFSSDDFDGARAAYQESLNLHREIGKNRLKTAALEGLVRIALAQEHPEQGLAYVEQILAQTENCQQLDGLINPFQVCLTCIQALQAVKDPRSPEILRCAREQLQAWAARISNDALRRSFLENITSNRELLNLQLDPE